MTTTLPTAEYIACALTDLEVDYDSEVVACPHPIDRLVKRQLRGLHARVGLGVSIPGPDEDVVEALAVARLADDLSGACVGVRILDRPRVTRPVASDGPGIVIEHTAAAE
jgi:hypothetical protein